MKSAEKIRRLFRSAELGTHPDVHERIFQDVLSAYQQTMAHLPAQPEIWRFVMRHSIVKYALAAAIILAAIMGFGLFHRTGNIAWAIEDSIQALSRYNGILIEGMDSERSWLEGGSLELRPCRMWAVANREQTMVEKARIEVEGIRVLVTDGEKTWRYNPQTNTVRIEHRPYVASECWLGSSFLEQLNSAAGSGVLTHYETTYEKDPATGEPRIVLTCAWLNERYNGPRSVRIELDPQSKLPVSLKQWENAERQGSPSYVAQKITYCESLPDDLFQYEIPAGATVVER
jgi:outer membrane lipoprotein-sorting protein